MLNSSGNKKDMVHPECDDCGVRGDLLVVSADLGQGAFLALLCTTCWHRREYRGILLHRLEWRRKNVRHD